MHVKRRKSLAEEISWTFFDHLNNICYGKKPWSDIDLVLRKTWNTFLALRFLSMDSNLIQLIDSIMYVIYTLPIAQQYQLLCHALPKQKRFLKYTGSKKSNKNVDSAELIQDLVNTFNVSTKQAIEYIQLLSIIDPSHNYIQYISDINGRGNTREILSVKKTKKRIKKG